MISISTKHRTNQSEMMDDFDMEGNDLKDALDKIAKINQVLGGNKLTLQGIEQLIKNKPTEETITIVDVGCGSGAMLRTLADYAENNKLDFKLIGVDANNCTINYARELSLHYPYIKYRCEDIFDKPFTELKYDIVLCTLTLHHFKDEEIIKLLEIFKANAKLGIVINDLERSSISYRLFQALCFIFRLNDMSRKDGLVSILRGFKKTELEQFSKKLNFRNYKIQWKWAFRYQWIISID